MLAPAILALVLSGEAGSPAGTPVLLAVRNAFGEVPEGVAVCRVDGDRCAPLPVSALGLDLRATLEGTPVTLRVSAPGFEPDETTFERLEEDEEFDVVPVNLVATSRLTARFVSPSKRKQSLGIEFRSASRPSVPKPLRREDLVLRPGPDETAFDVRVPPGDWLVEWSSEVVATGGRRIALPRDGRRDLGVIRLAPGRTVRGLVTNARGAPVASARVRIAPGEEGRMLAAARTDAAGAFEIRGLPADGELTVVTEARDHVTASSAWRDGPLYVLLEEATRIVGRTVDENGDPVEGIEVRLEPARPGGERSRTLFGARSGDDGEFTLRRSIAGDLVAVLTRPGRRTLRVSVPGAPPEGRDEIDLGRIRVGKGEIVRGVVADGETGAPLDGASVDAYSASEYPGSPGIRFMGEEVTTGADGTFELSVTPGAATLRVAKKGYAFTSRPIEAAGPNRVELFRGGRIEAAVCGDARTLAALRVTLFRSGADRPAMWLPASPEPAAFENVEPGTWRLQLWWSLSRRGAGRFGPARVRSEEVRVVSGQTSRASIACGPVRVAGRATADGIPVAESAFVLAAGGDSEGFPFVTDEVGAFSVVSSGGGRHRALSEDVGERFEGSCVASPSCDLRLTAVRQP